MSNKTKLVLSTMIALAPSVAMAATIDESITKVMDVLSKIPQLFLALALVYFLYGVFSYVAGAADEKKRTEARSAIVYGLIFMVIMSSVWGLVTLIQSSVGLSGGGTPPELPAVKR